MWSVLISYWCRHGRYHDVVGRWWKMGEVVEDNFRDFCSHPLRTTTPTRRRPVWLVDPFVIYLISLDNMIRGCRYD